MNLGRAQVLTRDEEFEFRCYDSHGVRSKNIYVAPNSIRTCLLHEHVQGSGGGCAGVFDVEHARSKCKHSHTSNSALDAEEGIGQRQRVARDRAEIERIDSEYRSRRNPGQRVDDETTSFFFGFERYSLGR